MPFAQRTPIRGSCLIRAVFPNVLGGRTWCPLPLTSHATQRRRAGGSGRAAACGSARLCREAAPGTGARAYSAAVCALPAGCWPRSPPFAASLARLLAGESPLHVLWPRRGVSPPSPPPGTLVLRACALHHWHRCTCRVCMSTPPFTGGIRTLASTKIELLVSWHTHVNQIVLLLLKPCTAGAWMAGCAHAVASGGVWVGLGQPVPPCFAKVW